MIEVEPTGGGGRMRVGITENLFGRDAVEYQLGE